MHKLDVKVKILVCQIILHAVYHQHSYWPKGTLAMESGPWVLFFITVIHVEGIAFTVIVHVYIEHTA